MHGLGSDETILGVARCARHHSLLLSYLFNLKRGLAFVRDRISVLLSTSERCSRRQIYWSCFGSFSPSIRKPRTFRGCGLSKKNCCETGTGFFATVFASQPVASNGCSWLHRLPLLHGFVAEKSRLISEIAALSLSDSSAIQYLKFERERTRPAADLLDGVPSFDPQSCIDLGCGPGNSTELLVRRFPGSAIAGCRGKTPIAPGAFSAGGSRCLET